MRTYVFLGLTVILTERVFPSSDTKVLTSLDIPENEVYINHHDPTSSTLTLESGEFYIPYGTKALFTNVLYDQSQSARSCLNRLKRSYVIDTNDRIQEIFKYASTTKIWLGYQYDDRQKRVVDPTGNLPILSTVDSYIAWDYKSLSHTNSCFILVKDENEAGKFLITTSECEVEITNICQRKLPLLQHNIQALNIQSVSNKQTTTNLTAAVRENSNKLQTLETEQENLINLLNSALGEEPEEGSEPEEQNQETTEEPTNDAGSGVDPVTESPEQTDRESSTQPAVIEETTEREASGEKQTSDNSDQSNKTDQKETTTAKVDTIVHPKIIKKKAPFQTKVLQHFLNTLEEIKNSSCHLSI